MNTATRVFRDLGIGGTIRVPEGMADDAHQALQELLRQFGEAYCGAGSVRVRIQTNSIDVEFVPGFLVDSVDETPIDKLGLSFGLTRHLSDRGFTTVGDFNGVAYSQVLSVMGTYYLPEANALERALRSRNRPLQGRP